MGNSGQRREQALSRTARQASMPITDPSEAKYQSPGEMMAVSSAALGEKGEPQCAETMKQCSNSSSSHHTQVIHDQ
jgi:hypothetical protein